MHQPAKGGTPMSTYLYTNESTESRRRAEKDQGAPDPAPEVAIAVLQGEGPPEKEQGGPEGPPAPLADERSEDADESSNA
jgi:hypothetical protein